MSESHPLPEWQQLVEAPALAAALGHPHLRVVDARFALADPHAGRQGHAQSHLPGAAYADLDTDLSDLGRRGLGRHPLPDAAAFARTLGRWGIAPHTQVVVYDAGDGSMAAARLWWMLGLLGHRRAAVLDGGLAEWRRLGLPETPAVAAPASLPPYPQRFDASRIATAEEVVARLHEAPGWLLDARAGERFRGEAEPIDPLAGHVPGAINRPSGQNLRDGRLRPPQELRAELEPLLHGRDPREVVVMCGSGVTACHLLLALERAGLHGARVYAGSWSGWIADPSRPRAGG
ncbi:sulfurtransferase [Xanthomonas theicola]|uniref:Sulfurtransferase n=1 Tax=Xanthomonas theicola TaxID=56464 RepID=A0A2S6ZK95_9XANT|nr:sulfurtransferase [Xanthomonas theicola]PPT92540.1 sulfurtransferase [Xanthomonas theicola]QNH25489.1 sulfurtransferase [Xanthomonas theicola]